MNIPSFHQNDLFNDLAQKHNTFEVVYAHKHDKNRMSQGWNFNSIQHYESKIIGEDLNFIELIFHVYKNRRSTHIVNGIWAEKSFLFVLILLNIFRSNFLIYSEAPTPIKHRNFIKKVLLKCLVKPLCKLVIIRAKGFLAVSVFAVKYFESMGIKNDRIYRFGYFRNATNDSNFPKQFRWGLNFRKVEQAKFKRSSNNKTKSLIFVGQLIERKGILTLLEAIKSVARTNQSFHLTIIGTGELEPLLKAFINKNQLQDTVTLLGVINSENIANYIEKADLLILPSVFDGWGMVINEALQGHVPVLISDQCGAKELIKHHKNGLIFQHDNLNSLTENLQKFLDLSQKERDKMKKCAGEMGERISIPIVSNYLSHCLNHCLKPQSVKPTAPWLNE